MARVQLPAISAAQADEAEALEKSLLVLKLAYRKTKYAHKDPEPTASDHVREAIAGRGPPAVDQVCPSMYRVHLQMLRNVIRGRGGGSTLRGGGGGDGSIRE